MTVFKNVQTNGCYFRAQYLKFENKHVLWIAESSTEIYSISFDKALSADFYPTETNTKIIFLYVEDDQVETIEFGNFSSDDCTLFLQWLQKCLN